MGSTVSPVHFLHKTSRLMFIDTPKERGIKGTAVKYLAAQKIVYRKASERLSVVAIGEWRALAGSWKVLDVFVPRLRLGRLDRVAVCRSFGYLNLEGLDKVFLCDAHYGGKRCERICELIIHARGVGERDVFEVLG
ncbi:hypothetical protein CRG98_001053 [Punica granatum]|uniref:Uncharacterized protein n=1 Tax=Punica granatum TaxID=22663 RepID=A0A2I0LEA1_PUNGR|nr:hypothetical protein CRG98_001053 [Punica granatum]